MRYTRAASARDKMYPILVVKITRVKLNGEKKKKILRVTTALIRPFPVRAILRSQATNYYTMHRVSHRGFAHCEISRDNEDTQILILFFSCIQEQGLQIFHILFECSGKKRSKKIIFYYFRKSEEICFKHLIFLTILTLHHFIFDN